MAVRAKGSLATESTACRAAERFQHHCGLIRDRVGYAVQLPFLSHQGARPAAAGVSAVARLHAGTDVAPGHLNAIAGPALLAGGTGRLDAADGAVQRRFDHHPIAHRDRVDRTTDFRHRPDDLMAEGEREGGEWSKEGAARSGDGRQVAAADAAEVRTEPHPLGTGQSRHVHLAEPQESERCGKEARESTPHDSEDDPGRNTLDTLQSEQDGYLDQRQVTIGQCRCWANRRSRRSGLAAMG